MKILLTGATGQLGRALQATLADHDVAALGSRELDVTDLEAVRGTVESTGAELVLNAAAWTDVDGAQADPEGAFRVNGLGPRNLALATRACGAALLHVSTDYVFDGESDRPYCEFDATNPQSVYGHSKLAGEDAVRTFNERHWIVRTAWLYSPWRKNFALTMRGLASRDEVRVVNDQVGSPTYAPHLARGIARLVETDAYGTYHLAGSGQASWRDARAPGRDGSLSAAGAAAALRAARERAVAPDRASALAGGRGRLRPRPRGLEVLFGLEVLEVRVRLATQHQGRAAVAAVDVVPAALVTGESQVGIADGAAEIGHVLEIGVLGRVLESGGPRHRVPSPP